MDTEDLIFVIHPCPLTHKKFNHTRISRLIRTFSFEKFLFSVLETYTDGQKKRYSKIVAYKHELHMLTMTRIMFQVLSCRFCLALAAAFLLHVSICIYTVDLFYFVNAYVVNKDDGSF